MTQEITVKTWSYEACVQPASYYDSEQETQSLQCQVYQRPDLHDIFSFVINCECGQRYGLWVNDTCAMLSMLVVGEQPVQQTYKEVSFGCNEHLIGTESWIRCGVVHEPTGHSHVWWLPAVDARSLLEILTPYRTDMQV